ncbi:MAG: YkgJ family cysteine cluster protein [Candidatus Micrarchaeia archaeon]
MEFCKGCDYSCCGYYSIPLSAVDIFIILSHGWNDFFYVCEKEVDDGYCFRINGKLYGFMMKRRIQGGCVFMREGGEYGCGIHPYKPSVCAVYPFVVEEGKIKMMDNRICAKDRIPTEKDLAEAQTSIEAYNYEWDLHKKIAERWNKSFLSKYGWPGLIIGYVIMQMLIWNIAVKLGRLKVDNAN